MIDAKTDEAVKKILDLKKLKLPAKPRVVDLRHEVTLDWAGDPSVRVWLIFEDAAFDTDWKVELEPYLAKVRHAVEASGLGLLPYVSARTQSEQAALEAGTYYDDEDGR